MAGPPPCIRIACCFLQHYSQQSLKKTKRNAWQGHKGRMDGDGEEDNNFSNMEERVVRCKIQIYRKVWMSNVHVSVGSSCVLKCRGFLYTFHQLFSYFCFNCFIFTWWLCLSLLHALSLSLFYTICYYHTLFCKLHWTKILFESQRSYDANNLLPHQIRR